MDDMELDSEQIIFEVQALPFLYDPKHPDYKNRPKRKSGWLTVTSNVVGEAWNDMDSGEKDVLGKEVQKRWKSIKDCYNKNIKIQECKSGEAVKPRKNYIYHKQLSFLKSSPAKRRSTRNVDNYKIEYNTDTDSKPFEDEDIAEIKNKPNISTAPPQPRALQNEKQSPFLKRRRFDEFEAKFMNVMQTGLQKSPPKESTSGANDPDEMFLLSQLPLIKNLSLADKLNFQIKYLQLVYSYSADNDGINFQP